MKKNIVVFFIFSLVFCSASFSVQATVDPFTDDAVDLFADTVVEPFAFDDKTIQPFDANYFEMNSQNVTAYTASKYKADGKLRYTASEELPQSGFVAMKAATVRSSVPFGSIVETPIRIKNYEGVSLDGFFVQDTGVDPNLTDYAIDVWWGFCRTSAYLNSDVRLGCSANDAAYTSALQWGQPKMKLAFWVKTP